MRGGINASTAKYQSRYQSGRGLETFYPEHHLKPETSERAVRHIAQFSFGALKELKK
jgi:hypothetical protein